MRKPSQLREVKQLLQSPTASQRQSWDSVQSVPALAPEGMLLQPHKVHLKSVSSWVSRKDVGTYPLQVNLPPEKGHGHSQAPHPDQRLLRSPYCGPSAGAIETVRTVLQFGKADHRWGGTAMQVITTSLPQFPHWILAFSP